MASKPTKSALLRGCTPKQIREIAEEKLVEVERLRVSITAQAKGQLIGSFPSTSGRLQASLYRIHTEYDRVMKVKPFWALRVESDNCVLLQELTWLAANDDHLGWGKEGNELLTYALGYAEAYEREAIATEARQAK